MLSDGSVSLMKKTIKWRHHAADDAVQSNFYALKGDIATLLFISAECFAITHRNHAIIMKSKRRSFFHQQQTIKIEFNEFCGSCCDDSPRRFEALKHESFSAKFW